MLFHVSILRHQLCAQLKACLLIHSLCICSVWLSPSDVDAQLEEQKDHSTMKLWASAFMAAAVVRHCAPLLLTQEMTSTQSASCWSGKVTAVPADSRHG